MRLGPVDPDARAPTSAGGRAAGSSSPRRPAAGRRRRRAPRWSGPRAPAPRPPACCASTPTVQAAQRDGCSRGSAGERRPVTVGRRPPARADALADRADRRPRRRHQGPARRAARRAAPGWPGFVGDDGAPVPGSDLVAACDAILPSMVERDPEWAGWCAVLVNVNDLAAMGAAPVGLLDAVGARDASFAARVLAGLRARRRRLRRAGARRAHPARRARRRCRSPRWAARPRPVPAGGGRPGHAGPADRRPRRRLAARATPVGSGTPRRRARPPSCARWWRRRAGRARARPPPRTCRWPGSSARSACSPRPAGAARCSTSRPCPRPAGATVGDWLTCFPGFAMLTADEPARPPPPAGPRHGAVCGELRTGDGRRGRPALARRRAHRAPSPAASPGLGQRPHERGIHA